VSQTIDFSKRDAAAAGGSEFTGLQIEAGGKISAITCNPGVQGCMALTTPQLLRIFDVEASREFSSKDFQAEDSQHVLVTNWLNVPCRPQEQNHRHARPPRIAFIFCRRFPWACGCRPESLGLLERKLLLLHWQGCRSALALDCIFSHLATAFARE
jgi:hypothetical protein